MSDQEICEAPRTRITIEDSRGSGETSESQEFRAEIRNTGNVNFPSMLAELPQSIDRFLIDANVEGRRGGPESIFLRSPAELVNQTQAVSEEVVFSQEAYQVSGLGAAKDHLVVVERQVGGGVRMWLGKRELGASPEGVVDIKKNEGKEIDQLLTHAQLRSSESVFTKLRDRTVSVKSVCPDAERLRRQEEELKRQEELADALIIG